VSRDWLLILALQTTFNVHYFFFVVLVLVIKSLPYTAAMMIIIVKNTIKSFAFFFSVYHYVAPFKIGSFHETGCDNPIYGQVEF
jgi:hypothetical protein